MNNYFLWRFFEHILYEALELKVTDRINLGKKLKYVTALIRAIILLYLFLMGLWTNVIMLILCTMVDVMRLDFKNRTCFYTFFGNI